MKRFVLMAVLAAACGGTDKAGPGEVGSELSTCTQPASCTICTVKVGSGSCSTVEGCCTCALTSTGLTVTLDGQAAGLVAEQAFYAPTNIAYDYGNTPSYSTNCSSSFGVTFKENGSPVSPSTRVGTEWTFFQWQPQWGTPTH